jgi:hypothetical protein
MLYLPTLLEEVDILDSGGIAINLFIQMMPRIIDGPPRGHPYGDTGIN